MKLVSRLRRTFDTLAARLALVLTIGIAFAAIVSLMVAERYRDRELSRIRADRITMSAVDIASRLTDDGGALLLKLKNDEVFGAGLITGQTVSGSKDSYLDAALAARFPAGSRPIGMRSPPRVCIGDGLPNNAPRAAGFVTITPECWVVSFITKDGQRVAIGLTTPPSPVGAGFALRPVFLLLIVLIAALISVAVAWLTLRFMRRLTAAARRFAQDIDAPPIAERGPSDVVETFAAFNLMQSRVAEAMRERTRILAAVSHDLQTPLTRIRLRTEMVEPAPLQTKLLADMMVMQRLVGEGLALARAHEPVDDWAPTDLGSLLESIVEDARDEGKDVTLAAHEVIVVWLRPAALIRCLQNLIDNAVAYGTRASIACIAHPAYVTISVRDSGHGINQADLERMFEPFVRGDTSRSRRTGGTGIGLTIVRAQAATFNATVTLENHVGGGLVASIAIPRSQPA